MMRPAVAARIVLCLAIVIGVGLAVHWALAPGASGPGVRIQRATVGPSPPLVLPRHADDRRESLAHAWDVAGLAAVHVRARPGGGKVMVRTLAGIPSLVVDAKATIADLRRAAPADVRETAPGVWELDRSVWVVHGATLSITAPEVRELRLVSRGSRFATIAARDANLRVVGTRSRKLVIRSWQAPRGGPDRDLRDGRPSVMVGSGRFDAFDAAFLDLGYFEGRLSGVAVTAPRGGVRATGHFRRSDFIGNFFGAYTYEARDIPWVDDRFLRNVVYGLDPHDDSDGFLVRGSLAAGNGRHGIIFSRLCDHNLVTRNVAVANGWHGIVIDDGKLGDGPSEDNRLVANSVRANGRVGISVDGSGENRIAHNHVAGQPIGIRLYGRALGNTVEYNAVSRAAHIGIFVDAPAAANAVEDNRLTRTATAIAVRGAQRTVVQGNSISSADGHGVSVVPSRGGPATSVAVVDNEIDGGGSSAIRVEDPRRFYTRGNQITWHYGAPHVMARILGWGIGPSLWLIVFGVAAIGPALFRVGDRATRRRRLLRLAAGAVALAVVATLTVRMLSPGGPTVGLTIPVPTSPHDPRRGSPGAVSSDAAPLALRVVSLKGDATHPTWYHDTQVAETRGDVVVAWNGVDDVRAARLRASDLRIIDKTKLNDAELGGAVDSTGTDTKRHDIPAVVVDRAGSLHFLYGGGTIAGLRLANGPYYRATTRQADLQSLTPERQLHIGGGAAFDFESITDSAGVRHIIGQRGRGHTGSLIELRMTSHGRWLPPRQLIAGGFRPKGCVLGGRPRGCNVFAIARMAAAADGTLQLIWGFSEASLGGKCHTDRGYCDNDLFYAVSHDGGASWSDASGAARVTLRPGRSLGADEPRFRVAAGHIGLFKAIAAGPSGPLVVFSEVDAQGASLKAARLAGGRWKTSVIARPGELDVKSWNGSLVLRRDPTGYTLWTPADHRIFRFSSPDGVTWHPLVAYRGSSVWSLTGIPSRTPGRELAMWRGERHGKRSQVIAAILPTGGG